MLIKPYVAIRPSSADHFTIRGLRYLLRTWGNPDAPLLLCLHGHRDASATFQFMADRLTKDWRIVAPDWRGHGDTGWAPQGYYYQDYLADLDAIVDHVSPGEPVAMLGHSLGGNIATVYAGVRPQKVKRFASIDGFGLRGRYSVEMPDHLRDWLDSTRRQASGRVYLNEEAMADRLMAANKRLTRDKALFLAAHSHKEVEGGYTWSFDPGHQRPFATLYRLEEWAACWKCIEAPALWIAAGDRFERMERTGEGGFEWRLAHIRNGEYVQVPETGHNIHHDSPEEIAHIVDDFFARDD